MGALISLSKSATEHWLSGSEAALLGFGLLLVIGVVGEMRLPFWSTRQKWFEVLVIIGIAGELLGDGGVFFFSAHLQTLSDVELGQAVADAGGAIARAGVAIKEAGRAKERAANADEHTETLRKENLILQSDLLGLRKEAEARRLTGLQRETLRQLLEGHPSTIAIVSRLVDIESSDFADDFDSAFRAAHWQPSRIINRLSSKYGVSVGMVAGTSAPEIKVVSDALTAIGVSNSIVAFMDRDINSIAPPFQPNVVYLVIEQHPPLTANTKNQKP